MPSPFNSANKTVKPVQLAEVWHVKKKIIIKIIIESHFHFYTTQGLLTILQAQPEDMISSSYLLFQNLFKLTPYCITPLCTD